ncbi:unnamed protein product [Discosporangium mesarthrocarpum]
MMEQGSSLVLVDWLTSGRMSRGEGWSFSSMESRNEVMVEVPGLTAPGGGCQWEAAVIDHLLLEDLPQLTVEERMRGMQVKMDAWLCAGLGLHISSGGIWVFHPQSQAREA